jgi:hypothetical protein
VAGDEFDGFVFGAELFDHVAELFFVRGSEASDPNVGGLDGAVEQRVDHALEHTRAAPHADDGGHVVVGGAEGVGRLGGEDAFGRELRVVVRRAAIDVEGRPLLRVEAPEGAMGRLEVAGVDVVPVDVVGGALWAGGVLLLLRGRLEPRRDMQAHFDDEGGDCGAEENEGGEHCQHPKSADDQFPLHSHPEATSLNK